MQVKCDEYNGVCVLAVDGDFAGEATSHFKQLAEARFKDRRLVDFVVDLEKVPFLNSQGLEALLWLKRRCDELFGHLKLTGMDANCQKIFEVNRLAHRFECYADVPSALKLMR